MKVSRIELIEIRMPLVHFFETSFGRTDERRIILARVEDADGSEGWGECTAGESPSYCEEWTESCWAVLTEILINWRLEKLFVRNKFSAVHLAKVAVQLFLCRFR